LEQVLDCDTIVKNFEGSCKWKSWEQVVDEMAEEAKEKADILANNRVE